MKLFDEKITGARTQRPAPCLGAGPVPLMGGIIKVALIGCGFLLSIRWLRLLEENLPITMEEPMYSIKCATLHTQ